MAFTIDFVAAYAVLAVLLAGTFITATGAISTGLTMSYAGELAPVAGRVGDVLLHGTGDPEDWHVDPSHARSPRIIGLSTGDPNVISVQKADALCLYNASALKRAVGLVDEEGQYGLRVEIGAVDGSFFRSAGYPLPPDTKDVRKSVRIASIGDQDGIYRDAVLVVYLWRRDVGAR